MSQWLRISLLLCFFGFLREIRPSEPFVTDYMMYPWRNITSEMVNRYVYPIGTYSYAAQLVAVFLITDFLRYKPLIIACGISGVIVWSMLIYTTSLRNLQILEIFYGTYMATEVAYYTYIYAKVDKEHYSKVTSHTRAAILAGRFAAGTLGQILFYTKLMDFRQLNFITLGAQACATIWACFLPSVQTSLYFNRRKPKENIIMELEPVEAPKENQYALKLLWLHFKTAYTNSNVILWSVWYAMGMCGYLQVISYIQLLWTSIDNTQEMIWNGAVEACITLLGAAVSLLAGYLHAAKLKRKQILWALLLLSIGEGCSILLTSKTSHRSVSYIGYLIFCVLYSFTITVASAEIAKHLTVDSFGLIFGINTLIALILQSILTISVVSYNGLSLDIFQQFTVYGYYFFVLSFFYLLGLLFNLFGKKPRNLNQDH